MSFSTRLKTILIILLLVGVVFRFVNVSHKVYSHDEVYTSLRAAGYTRLEIDQELFRNQPMRSGELQKFQQIKPGSTVVDTVRSLTTEVPQHPPLYFGLARFWMQLFGGSTTASRLLPVFISLLSLPLMYALAWELFASPAAALMATTLLALSPFDVLFAQTARQYSLLTVMVIASQWLLMRALRLSRESRPNRFSKHKGILWKPWGSYGLVVAIGLYTQPLFGLAVVAQAVFVGLGWLTDKRHIQATGTLYKFGLSLLGAGILYTPWLWILISNRNHALETADWTQTLPGIDYLLKFWTLSFTALFLDLDFGFNNPITFLLRIPLLLLIGIAFYRLCLRGQFSSWLLVLTSAVVPFLLLASSDLLLGNSRSAISRYLIFCYPSVQLAIAHLLATQLTPKFKYSLHGTTLKRKWSWVSAFSASPLIWRGVFTLVVLASLVSLTASAASFTWWNKVPSYFNNEVAQQINPIPNPIIVSDLGADYTNTGDLISLSYLLKKDTPLLLLKDANWAKTQMFQNAIRGTKALVFRPSVQMQQSLQETYGTLQPFNLPAGFWQIP